MEERMEEVGARAHPLDWLRSTRAALPGPLPPASAASSPPRPAAHPLPHALRPAQWRWWWWWWCSSPPWRCGGGGGGNAPPHPAHLVSTLRMLPPPCASSPLPLPYPTHAAPHRTPPPSPRTAAQHRPLHDRGLDQALPAGAAAGGPGRQGGRGGAHAPCSWGGWCQARPVCVLLRAAWGAASGQGGRGGCAL